MADSFLLLVYMGGLAGVLAIAGALAEWIGGRRQ